MSPALADEDRVAWPSQFGESIAKDIDQYVHGLVHAIGSRITADVTWPLTVFPGRTRAPKGIHGGDVVSGSRKIRGDEALPPTPLVVAAAPRIRDIRGRHHTAIVGGVATHAQPDLSQIAHTADGLGTAAHRLNCRHQHGRQEGHDHHHHEELYEGGCAKGVLHGPYI